MIGRMTGKDSGLFQVFMVSFSSVQRLSQTLPQRTQVNISIQTQTILNRTVAKWKKLIPLIWPQVNIFFHEILCSNLDFAHLPWILSQKQKHLNISQLSSWLIGHKSWLRHELYFLKCPGWHDSSFCPGLCDTDVRTINHLNLFSAVACLLCWAPSGVSLKSRRHYTPLIHLFDRQGPKDYMIIHFSPTHSSSRPLTGSRGWQKLWNLPLLKWQVEALFAWSLEVAMATVNYNVEVWTPEMQLDYTARPVIFSGNHQQSYLQGPVRQK